jgi:hypothetical protein
MAARLGNGLYWLGCIVAAAFIAFDMYDAAQNGIIGHTRVFFLSAVIAWLIGRACQYLLAGK